MDANPPITMNQTRRQRISEALLSEGGVSYLVPFILLTSCFALWGFANDITNPMVKAFSKIFRMSVTDGTMIQVAFYGGYFVMAFLLPYSYAATPTRQAYCSAWDSTASELCSFIRPCSPGPTSHF